MRSGDYLAYTWRNVGRARLRLLLTVSAVVIGATLIVVMTSIGGGIQRNVLEDIRAAGGLNEILVSAGLRPQPGGPGLRPTAALNGETVQAISRLDGVVAVLPEMLLSGVEITYDGLVAQPLIIGVPEEYAAAYGFPPALGRPVPARGQVVLGARVPEVFFDANRQRAPAPALIGQTVQLVARRAGVPAPGLPGFGAPVPAPPAQYTKDLEVVGLLRVQGTQDDFTAWLTVEDVLDVFEWFTGRRPDPQVAQGDLVQPRRQRRPHGQPPRGSVRCEPQEGRQRVDHGPILPLCSELFSDLIVSPWNSTGDSHASSLRFASSSRHSPLSSFH